jgi:hypothetical protein
MLSLAQGNSNVSRITKGADMVKEEWFMSAINSTEPVDLFLLIGHNIARPTTGGSTFSYAYDAIREIHPSTPIQIFGWCRHPCEDGEVN